LSRGGPKPQAPSKKKKKTKKNEEGSVQRITSSGPTVGEKTKRKEGSRRTPGRHSCQEKRNSEKRSANEHKTKKHKHLIGRQIQEE